MIVNEQQHSVPRDGLVQEDSGTVLGLPRPVFFDLPAERGLLRPETYDNRFCIFLSFFSVLRSQLEAPRYSHQRKWSQA